MGVAQALQLVTVSQVFTIKCFSWVWELSFTVQVFIQRVWIKEEGFSAGDLLGRNVIDFFAV
jgi:hypothetical protein